LYCKQSPANVDVKRIIKAFLGNGAERVAELANPGASKEDVDMTLLLFDYLEEPIEVGEIAGIALNASGILTDFFDCFVELFLAAASDKEIIKLL
jgi:hypothetical protein